MIGSMRNIALNAILAVGVAACQVGPQYTQPDQETASEWHVDVRDDFRFEPPDSIEWWQIFNDPVLSNLIKLAHVQNNNIKVAGLRVIEARAALGIATGSRYPQSQFAAGDLTSIRVSEDDGAGGGDVEYTRANLGVNVVWEADFWGDFFRA